MAEFVKNGKKITPKVAGTEYDLIPGQVYNMCESMFDPPYLEENGDLNLNFKIYNSEEDLRFMDKVINTFNSTNKQTTGVLLNGMKGTGKTVMAKQIAKKTGLPIIIVQPEVSTNQLEKFFSKFTTEAVIIFDEFEKHWNSEKLLGFLDGVAVTAKKLVLFTSNSNDRVSEYMKDRCSRVRYVRHFYAADNARFLKTIIKDKGLSDPKDKLYNFMVNNFKVLSIDNILSFLDEKLMYPDDTNENLVMDMNIQTKTNLKKNKKYEEKVTTIDPEEFSAFNGGEPKTFKLDGNNPQMADILKQLQQGMSSN